MFHFTYFCTKTHAMKLHRLFIITLSFILTLCTAAQEMKIFSSDGYLSSCLVNKIYQDSKGFVWIATEYGLNRFDGTRFVTYKNVPGDSTSLCDNYVRTLTETRDGKILVGTLKGLMEWDRARESFSYIPIYVKGTRITPMCRKSSSCQTVISGSARRVTVYFSTSPTHRR